MIRVSVYAAAVAALHYAVVQTSECSTAPLLMHGICIRCHKQLQRYRLVTGKFGSVMVIAALSTLLFFCTLAA